MFGCCSFAVVRISATESLGAEHGRELGTEHLQRDGAVVPNVASQVDDGHPP